jgi:hypothetical protein
MPGLLCAICCFQNPFFLRRDDTDSQLVRVLSLSFHTFTHTLRVANHPVEFRATMIKEAGVDTLSHRKSLPLCVSALFTVLLPSNLYLQSCVEREMSIDMVNDVLDTITVDPMDDGLFSFQDNIVSGKTRAVDSPSRAANMI